MLLPHLLALWAPERRKKPERKKKEEKFGHLSRERPSSLRPSDTDSRLLYNGLPRSFPGLCSLVYAPILQVIIDKLSFLSLPALRLKTCCQKAINQMEIVNQDLDGSLSLSLSTGIPLHMDRNRSMNRSRRDSRRIDMSDRADLYMFWPRPFPLQRRRFRSFNLMS